MRIELERRASASGLFSVVSPILALTLTLLSGALLFLMLG
jgi:general nucleoside transport system permease protein